MTIQALLTLLIFAAVAVLLIWRPIDPVLVCACIPVILTLLGILDPAEAFSQFANTTVIFFMSLLVVGKAIFKSGLADFLGEKIIGLVGKSEKGVILGTALVTTGLSAFLNDTGTTGCLIPIAGAVGKKSRVSLSKIYMVLAFFASVGGTITLIGSGSHVVVQGFLEEAGYAGFTFFEFVRIGLPYTIFCLLWLWFFGMKRLPVTEIREENIPAPTERNPGKMLLTAAVFVFIVFCMASGLMEMHVAAALGACLLVLTGCLSVGDAIGSFSASTLFLVAGVFTLSSAMASSGAAQYIVDFLSLHMAGIHPLFVVAAVSLISIVATNFMMGTSLAAILAPMVLLVGEACGVNPHALAMAVAICTSGAFCTPFGTGPNLLVYDIGNFKFTDYTRSGLAYGILMFLFVTFGVYFFYLV